MPLFARTRPWLGSLASPIACATVFAATSVAGAQTATEVAQVKEDVRSMADGVKAYRAHVGSLPGSLMSLVQPMVDANGKTLPPYMRVIPAPQPGWSALGTPHSSSMGRS